MQIILFIIKREYSHIIFELISMNLQYKKNPISKYSTIYGELLLIDSLYSELKCKENQ